MMLYKEKGDQTKERTKLEVEKITNLSFHLEDIHVEHVQRI